MFHMTTRTFKIYRSQVGNPRDEEHFQPREDLTTIEARSAYDALDKIAARINAGEATSQHVRRVGYSIPVLGFGSIKAEEIS